MSRNNGRDDYSGYQAGEPLSIFGKAREGRLFVQNFFPGADGAMNAIDQYTDNDFYRYVSECKPGQYHIMEIMFTQTSQIIWSWFTDSFHVDDMAKQGLSEVEGTRYSWDIYDNWKAVWSKLTI